MINGVLFRLRTGLPSRDLPPRFGSGRRCTTGTADGRRTARGRGFSVPSRLRPIPTGGSTGRWSAWTPLCVAPISMPPGARKRAPRVPGKLTRPARHRDDEALGRSRGGFTCKIHLVSEGGRRPLAFVITPGQWGDAPQLIEVLDRIRVARAGGRHPRTRPDHLCADRAYSSRRIRRYLRRRQIKHAIPEPTNQLANRQRRGSAGGRPTGFDKEIYRRRNEAERTMNAIKGFRAVATRYEERAYVFHGSVLVTALRLWLRG
ncbi:IS5 family transposase [Streptomyces sp. NPDC002055]|uniref:IS5 family transposase n=1 Tax=Streptomyces sp. NPDC002055 TaxID=3154534 RepID=UPI00332BBD61